MDTALIEFYSKPQSGGAISFYQGVKPQQFGGGFLGGIMRSILPILKNIGKGAISVAAKTADDVVNNQSTLKDSLIKNTANQFINNDDEDKTIYSRKRKRNVSSNPMRKKRAVFV